MRTMGKMGLAERQARVTEAFLLVLALLVQLAGCLLVLTAKAHDVPATDRVLSLNRATAGELVHALGIPSVFADRIVAERQRVGGFGDVEAIGRIPVVPSPRGAAEHLRAGGFPAPQSAKDAAVLKRLLDLDAPTDARFEALRAAMPTAKRWERVLGAPLLSAGAVAAATPNFVVRTWRDSVTKFLLIELAIAVFFVGTHLLLRRFRPGADPFLLPVTALLTILGTLTLFSLKDPVRDMPAYASQAQGVLIGGGLALLFSLSGWMAKRPLHRYGYLYALVSIGATVLLGVAGVGPVGAKLSVAGVQPIEGIKILLAFFLAAYLAERAPVLNDPLHRWGPFAIPRKADIMPLLVLFTLPLALFALVRDLGPILLLFGTFLILLYLATGRAAYVGGGALAMLVASAVGYRLHFGVFYVRADMWLSPWRNTHKGGDQTALGLWGLASGGPFGSGLGLGATHLIPRGGSDLAFAAVGEEMGLAGAFLATLCLLTIAGRGFAIARRAATDFDRYLAAGLSCLIGLQAIIIIGGTLGLIPLAGITVPFVSYGKSSLLACFFIVGTLLSLSSRRGAQTVVPQPTAETAPPEFRRASSRMIFVGAAIVLPMIVLRLLWVQSLAANAIAGRSVRVPDADGISRPHVNPRLAMLAARIGRGRILDRSGVVLAATEAGVRRYPLGASAAHLVGYLDPAVGGPTGMELRADGDLRGFGTFADLVPLWRAKDLPGFRIPAGHDVTLSLDADLQKAALAALSEGAHAVRDRRTGRPQNRGAAVVLDVATGGVLASVTIPTYDPTTLTPATLHALNADPDHALINRAVSGYYPPGSTFKIVTASALLAAEKADLTVDCRHEEDNIYWHANGTTYARRRIADDEGDRPHGHIGMDDAISQSCNVYFAHAGLTAGVDALRGMATAYGLSRVPSPTDFGANLPDIGFGQGPMLVSPTEMAGVAQTVANGGVRLRPTYRLASAPPSPQNPVTSASAARLAAAMLRVTQSGTAAGRFSDLPFSVAGKTGTAQNNAGDRVAHSWFIGFAPADRPRIAFAVLVENGGYGAQAAVPIAHKILQAAAPLLSAAPKSR